MQTVKRLLLSFTLLALLVGSAPLGLAQTQIAKERRVSLSPGRSKTLRGKSDSLTSYVYKIRAEKDRRLEARVTSDGGLATFSVVPPGTQILDNAAGVKEWSGTLPETGEYSIVVVMNTNDAKKKTPYALEVSLK